MADTKGVSEKLISPKFRVSFPHVFSPNPKAKTKDGKLKYQISMLFPPDTDLKAMKKLAEDAAKAEWGTNLPKKLKTPFLKCGDYEYEGYEDGWTLVRGSTVQRPEIIDGKKQEITVEDDFYPGCWARASIRAYAWVDEQGGKGVSFSFFNLQKVKDDDRLGGDRTKAEDEFESVDDDDSGDSSESADSLFG